MSNIELVGLSVEQWKDYVTDNPYLVITICDPDEEIKENGNINEIGWLKLKFYDVSESTVGSFTRDDAKAIVASINILRKYINTIIIVGPENSRNSILKSLSLLINVRSEICTFKHNPLIYKTIMDVSMDYRPIIPNDYSNLTNEEGLDYTLDG